MGHIPPPCALSKGQWETQEKRDFAFDRWYRYESNPFGLFLLLKDKFQKKECPNAFAQFK
jgi:hypothetical protein